MEEQNECVEVRQAGLWAAGAEYRPCGLEHALAVAQRVGARLS